MNVLKDDFCTAAKKIAEQSVRIRRDLHKIPELAFQETLTAEYIASRLRKIGIPYQNGVAKTGIVGLIAGNPGKQTLLLRADMDALPIQEDKKRAGCSQHDGVMHACGHDGHVAVLLGVAELLWQYRQHLSCNIKLVFQPAEEDTGGAEPMIREGVLENPAVDAALSLHIMNDLEAGKIRVKRGAVMACPDEFDLKIIGKGGHGAYPHECVDPIAIAGQILCAFSALSARGTDPSTPCVISVCSICGGSFYNVIPDCVQMRGTVRLYDKALRKKLPLQLENIIKHYTSAYGANYEWDYRFMFPPLFNDAQLTEQFEKYTVDILGKENVTDEGKPSMAGDDFSYFADRVPSVYFNLGGANSTKGITMPLHSPDFDFDESCLMTGILAVGWFALHFGRED